MGRFIVLLGFMLLFNLTTTNCVKEKTLVSVADQDGSLPKVQFIAFNGNYAAGLMIVNKTEEEPSSCYMLVMDMTPGNYKVMNYWGPLEMAAEFSAENICELDVDGSGSVYLQSPLAALQFVQLNAYQTAHISELQLVLSDRGVLYVDTVSSQNSANSVDTVSSQNSVNSLSPSST